MTTTQELLESSFELNLNNYGPEDVERLNDWAIKAYAALEALQAEVKHLNLHLKATQSGRDAALARLAELEKQEPVSYISPKQLLGIKDGDARAGVYIPLRKTPEGNFTMPLFASAGASPVEPNQARELSDEEILEIYDVCNSCEYGTLKQRFARAIIAAINAKGAV